VDLLPKSVTRRRRIPLAVAVTLVIAAGLVSRAYPVLATFLGKYPGDALWALMVMLGIAFLRPDLTTRRLALFALAFCWLVEFSQLYQAPWINAIRTTHLGHLVLGTTFQSLDLLAYALGILTGVILDAYLFHQKESDPSLVS
jgi:hypothetical protein